MHNNYDFKKKSYKLVLCYTREVLALKQNHNIGI